MATKDEILAQAEALGAALAQDPRVKAFMAAQQALYADRAARDLMRSYHAQLDKFQQREQAGQPIEPDDKRKLADLQAQVAGHPLVKALQLAQVEYVALMNQVNQAMSAPLEAGPAAETQP